MFSARTGVVRSSGSSRIGVEGSTVGYGEEGSTLGVGGSDVASSDLAGVSASFCLTGASPASLWKVNGSGMVTSHPAAITSNFSN